MGVVVAGVEVVHPELHRPPQDGQGRLAAGRTALRLPRQPHRAEADPLDGQVAAKAELVAHVSPRSHALVGIVTAKKTRRRGTELDHALLAAAWEELIEKGYENLTMESVAERAKTSRPVIARRWTDRQALVLAAVGHRFEQNPLATPDHCAVTCCPTWKTNQPTAPPLSSRRRACLPPSCSGRRA